jgi:hypothetical protein
MEHTYLEILNGYNYRLVAVSGRRFTYVTVVGYILDLGNMLSLEYINLDYPLVAIGNQYYRSICF